MDNSNIKYYIEHYLRYKSLNDGYVEYIKMDDIAQSRNLINNSGFLRYGEDNIEMFVCNKNFLNFKENLHMDIF